MIQGRNVHRLLLENHCVISVTAAEPAGALVTRGRVSELFRASSYSVWRQIYGWTDILTLSRFFRASPIGANDATLIH